MTLRWIIVNFFTFENSIKKIFLQPEGHISLKWLLYALFRYSGSSVKKKRHLRSDAFLYDLQQQQFVVCRVCGNSRRFVQFVAFAALATICSGCDVRGSLQRLQHRQWFAVFAVFAAFAPVYARSRQFTAVHARLTLFTPAGSPEKNFLSGFSAALLSRVKTSSSMRFIR
ncbi:hypothetical protein NSQ24_22695 [Brevibacillus sp. FSL L8-0520]|uniref:hypothetical protein n=1 Tax=Brevibacillus sp. FSL L8-0520 TaxID=2954689 RepID=UPI0030CFCCD3